jgi:hypothetical protein
MAGRKRQGSIDTTIRDAAKEVLGRGGDGSYAGVAQDPEADPEFDAAMFSLFGEGLPEKGKPTPHYMDGIPRMYWLDPGQADVFDRKGVSPSYYRKKDEITFFDVMKEKFEGHYPSDAKKFIKQHFNPDNPYALWEGVEWNYDSNDREMKEYLRDEVIRLGRKSDDKKYGRSHPIRNTLLCAAACIGIFFYWNHLSQGNDGSSEGSGRPAAATASITPRQQTGPRSTHLPTASESSLPVGVAFPVNSPEITAMVFAQGNVPQFDYICRGESLDDVSMRLTGVSDYAGSIRQFNERFAFGPGYQRSFPRDRCTGRITLPPEVIPKPPTYYTRPRDRRQRGT